MVRRGAGASGLSSREAPETRIWALALVRPAPGESSRGDVVGLDPGRRVTARKSSSPESLGDSAIVVPSFVNREFA